MIHCSMSGNSAMELCLAPGLKQEMIHTYYFEYNTHFVTVDGPNFQNTCCLLTVVCPFNS